MRRPQILPQKRFPALLAVLAVLMGPVGCAGALPGRPAPVASREAGRVVELVNLYRIGIGLQPLQSHDAVAEVAQAHAEAMAAGRAPYSHEGLEERVAAVGRRIRHQAVGENLAAVPRSRVTPLERAVERWVLSDPHRQALEGCYDLTGVGVARSAAGVTYVSQLFVKRALAQPSEARRGADLEMAGCR